MGKPGQLRRPAEYTCAVGAATAGKGRASAGPRIPTTSRQGGDAESARTTRRNRGPASRAACDASRRLLRCLPPFAPPPLEPRDRFLSIAAEVDAACVFLVGVAARELREVHGRGDRSGRLRAERGSAS